LCKSTGCWRCCPSTSFRKSFNRHRDCELTLETASQFGLPLREMHLPSSMAEGSSKMCLLDDVFG